MIVGRQSLKFENPVYIRNGATVVGKKEGEGPLGGRFDVVVEDDMFGKKSWEEAESELQHQTVDKLFIKSGLDKEEVRFIFAGDLLGQLIATSFGVEEFNIPVLGIYGACSTMGESLALSAMSVNAGYGENVVALASSHFASAEKQFRFPLEYGTQRPLSSTWTVTGCGAYMVSSKMDCKQQRGGINRSVRISGVTIGKILDYGVKDSLNMGACMAPAAADLIYNNLKDFEVEKDWYDLIITGDLGYIGRNILLEMLREKGIDIQDRCTDCGIQIFNKEQQNTQSGGSGCGCSAVVLDTFVLPKLKSGELNRVLFVPTGALLSTISYNEGKSVPGIAHGIVLEGVEDGLC